MREYDLGSTYWSCMGFTVSRYWDTTATGLTSSSSFVVSRITNTNLCDNSNTNYTSAATQVPPGCQTCLHAWRYTFKGIHALSYGAAPVMTAGRVQQGMNSCLVYFFIIRVYYTTAILTADKVRQSCTTPIILLVHCTAVPIILLLLYY